ncbi:hypothetical protein [Limosilactobacillus fermentum]|uniref:hypothetical protein n=1 Tax=Limosilactobacillus fermentum TaxID=1613 RepID=UPI000A5BE6EC|nr:hypothetical protein [Limosilactobacillus fermentum]
MKSADYRNAPMEKMNWNVFIGVVLGQIVSSYTLGIVGVALDRVPSSMTLSSTQLHDPIQYLVRALGGRVINRAVW